MKKMAILWALAGCLTSLNGQEIAVLDSAVNNIAKQLLFFPHEKIYLHTDKPYYITGEKIFFRAFLLDAFSNQPDKWSRYVYVELINPADSVVQRLKIRPDADELFYGAILLPEELPQGNYKIRAYTQYMANQGESSFFSKYVRISDPQILSVQTQTDFQFTDEGRINVSLRFMDAKTKEVINPQSVTLRLNQDPAFTRKPDKEGWIRARLNVPAKATARVLYVELTANRRLFRQYLRIPYPEGDFDVSFYPEGGHLIAGQTSVVAFKAVNNDGTSLDIKGEVVDPRGEVVTEFKTFYDGMGDFFVNALPGERYQAVCHHGNRTLRFDLPEVQMNACALKSFIRDNKLWIAVNKYDPASFPELYLLIHSGGLITYAKAWDSSKEYITFDASGFLSGINHIVLLTNDLQVISERLFFFLNNDNGLAVFQTQKEAYRKREQVQSGIQLMDGEQLPLKGNFSIAVTNDREVIADTTSGILSGILLQSELRGPINNPEYYFQKGNKEAELAADLLMKTHGWTRYAIPDVIRGKLSYPSIPFEESQAISGTVKSGLFSKQGQNFKVSIISLNTGFFDLTETDENGRFVFRDFEFPDTTKYIIQALNPKGKGAQMTELFVDETVFPGIPTSWPPVIYEEEQIPVWLDYVAKADLQYTYENGMRVINLPELEVRGTYKDNKYKSSYYSFPDNSFSSEEIEQSTDIINLLYRVPGVVVRGENSIRIRGALGPPLIVIDDFPMMLMDGDDPDEETVSILNMINIRDIGQIDVLKNSANTLLFGPRGGGGVIAIHTKRGEWNSPLPSYNIQSVLPLGYQRPVAFYSPKYDSQESLENPNPDLRTTIYWNPNVVSDDEGKAKLDFYTADDPATYSVVIEGVSEDGRLIHYYGKGLIVVK